MNIGIIGSGNVGGALGKGWAKKGHSVVFGVRDTADGKVNSLLKDAGPNARAASVQEAAAFGDVVAFATPWPASQDAIRSAGDLKGKIVFDCTNPLKPDLSGLEIGQTTSAAEMFYCGDDASAKKAAAQLASDLGFEPIDAGGLTSARLLEPICMLWIRLAYGQGMGRDFAFRIMRR
jgi:8-hydroxy-5-deazaflavin:NADPH oxidoreductase